MPWPNEYRAGSPLLPAAVGSMQNWDGFAIHTYAYSNRLERMQMLEYGHAPITAEVIEANIELTTNHPNFAVWAVNAEGFYIGRLPTAYEDGRLKFSIGKEHLSIYYVLHAE